jgi:hypothetical protein
MGSNAQQNLIVPLRTMMNEPNRSRSFHQNRTAPLRACENPRFVVLLSLLCPNRSEQNLSRHDQDLSRHDQK